MTIQQKLDNLGPSWANRLSKSSGISASQIRRIISGKSSPNGVTALNLSKALNVSVEELLRFLPNRVRRISGDSTGRKATDNKPKLTRNDIKTIQNDYDQGMTCRELARKLNVSPTTISNYIRYC